MKNIIRKAKFIVPYLKGHCADLGSEDVNWNESLHYNLDKYSNKLILRVDKFGRPDVIQDLDEPLYNLKDRKFDTIILSEVIEHLKRPYDLLVNLKSNLSEDGRIIITIPNAQSLSEIQSSLSKFHHNKVYSEHLYSWGKHNLFTLIEEADYGIVEFKYISFYWNRNYLFRFVAFLIPFLRPNLFCVIKPKRKDESHI